DDGAGSRVVYWAGDRGRGDRFVPSASAVTTTPQGVQQIAAGDVNGDGKADLVIASADDSSVTLETNGGDGTSWAGSALTRAAAGAHAVVLADLDGDGDRDVIYASSGDDTVGWFRNDGGTFTQ